MREKKPSTKTGEHGRDPWQQASKERIEFLQTEIESYGDEGIDMDVLASSLRVHEGWSPNTTRGYIEDLNILRIVEIAVDPKTGKMKVKWARSKT